MKTTTKNLVFALFVVLGLLPARQLLAQTFTFGPETHSTTASVTYTATTGKFQYTDTANSSDDSANFPLTGAAAAVITTTNDWTASLTPNISARSMTAGLNASPHVWFNLGIYSKQSSGTYLLTFTLQQENNMGGANDENFPDGFYGTGVTLRGRTNGNDDVTTPLGASQIIQGGSVLLLSGQTNAPPGAKSIGAVTGQLTINYSAASNTVTGYYNGTAVGTYSLAGWGSAPALTMVVGGSSGQVGVAAGTATASDFYAGRFPQSAKSFSITTSASPVSGGTTSGEGTYTNGQSVTVIATPKGCYDFANWTVKSKVVSTQANYTFLASSVEALVANFTVKEDVIATASNPPKAGTTTGKGTYGCGKPVTVKATAATGYKFSAWYIGATMVSTANPYTFSASGTDTLTADFADVSVPSIAITSPTAATKVDATLLTVSGTAKNSLGVSDVVLTVNNNPVTTTTTNGWTNWSAVVVLGPGGNLLSAFALSEAGHASPTATVTVHNGVTGEAPAALAGFIGEVQVGTNAPFTISFGDATFEQFSADTNQGSSVGNYTYTQTGPNTATFVTAGFAPPSQGGPGGANFTFTSPTMATFTTLDGQNTGTLTLSPGSSLDVSSFSGWTVTSVDVASKTTTTTFGDGTFTSVDGNGTNRAGSYAAMQYGPMAVMVIQTDNDPYTGGVETNYSMVMFTSRSNAQFFVTIYDGAGDPPYYDFGTSTGVYHSSGVHYLAPASLNGMSVLIKPLQAQNNPGPATGTAGQATLATTYTTTNGTSKVANYFYTRTGADTAVLTVQTVAPPSGDSTSDASDTLYLTFQTSASATYGNGNGHDLGKMTFSTIPAADYFAPVALPQSVTVDFIAPGNGGGASCSNGTFTTRKHAGTYTYARFSPTVGMFILSYTDPAAAGEVDYGQMTFNSASGGGAYETENNGVIELGTFKLTK